MSITWLPREQGMVVRCNGCGAKYHTANISATNTRAWLKAHEGWGRGSRPTTKKVLGTKRHDLCPPCLATDKELHAKDLAEKEARKKLRDEARKAKFSSEPKPKKPRKKKASTAVSAGAVTTAEEASIGRPPTSSPSAASAPAPAT